MSPDKAPIVHDWNPRRVIPPLPALRGSRYSRTELWKNSTWRERWQALKIAYAQVREFFLDKYFAELMCVTLFDPHFERRPKTVAYVPRKRA